MVEDQDAFGGVRFIDPTREVHRRRCWQRWLERMTNGALAAARSGELDIWDDVAVSNWAANVLATLRRAEDDGDDDDDDGF